MVTRRREFSQTEGEAEPPHPFLPDCLGFALRFFERTDGGAETQKNKAVKTLALALPRTGF